MLTNKVPVTLNLTTELRDRATKAAKKRHTNVSQLVRDALLKYLDQCSVEDRERESQKQQQEEDKQLARRALRDLIPAPAVDETSTPTDDDADLYQEHARRIYDALEFPAERDKCVRDAIEAIKRRRPITNPGDTAILKRLESAIVDMRSQGMEPSPLYSPPDPPKTSPMSRLIDRIVGRLENNPNNDPQK